MSPDNGQFCLVHILRYGPAQSICTAWIARELSQEVPATLHYNLQAFEIESLQKSQIPNLFFQRKACKLRKCFGVGEIRKQFVCDIVEMTSAVRPQQIQTFWQLVHTMQSFIMTSVDYCQIILLLSVCCTDICRARVLLHKRNHQFTY